MEFRKSISGLIIFLTHFLQSQIFLFFYNKPPIIDTDTKILKQRS